MLKEFIEYLEERVKNGCIYVWGAQNQLASESFIKNKESGSYETRVLKLYKKRLEEGYDPAKIRCYDCSGLGMYWIQNLKKLSSSDMNANGMKGKCTIIDKGELKKGDWVFRVYTSGSNKGRAYHIGYVVDDELHVIEAKGRDYGVIKTTLNYFGKNYWNKFGRPKYFADEINGNDLPPETTPITRVLQNTNPYMKGDDVRWLQRALNNAGCSCGSVDGTFGKNTAAGVKEYQKSRGLTVTGFADKKTIEQLGGMWMHAWTAKRNMKIGTSGADVLELKQALNEHGYLAKFTNDIFGTGTNSAVKAFQRANDLKVDGIAGKNTVTKLGGVWRG